jgi:hypothetical protein
MWTNVDQPTAPMFAVSPADGRWLALWEELRHE